MARHGASAPRRQCGVGRREPLGGATEAYFMERAPAKTEFLRGRKMCVWWLWNKKFFKENRKKPR